MSETTQAPAVPEWTLSWRLQRALAHAGIGIDDIAEELGVSRSTVSRWLNEHGGPPRSGYLKLWAMRCGVPLEWLAGVRCPGILPPAQYQAPAEWTWAA